MAMHAFKKAGIKKNREESENLINFGNENMKHLPRRNNNLLIPLETASVGTASDGGYSSELLSTEDLSRQQPFAGGISYIC